MRRLVSLPRLVTGVFLGSIVIAAFSNRSLAGSHNTDLSLVPYDSANLYKRYCQACHGERGDGKGPAGKAMNPSATSFLTMSDTTSVEYIFKVTTQGKGSMPAWKNLLNDADRRSIAEYIKRAFISNPQKK